MERFLAFCGKDYSPKGGWNDFVGDYSSVDRAKEHLELYQLRIFTTGEDCCWWHIVDTTTQK